MNKELLIEIRKETGHSVMEIKKALEETNGDKTKALQLLKQRGAEVMQKKGDREVKSGFIDAYSHNGQIGVLVEVQCETDFVARNPEFQSFVHDLCLQVSAMNPQDVKELLTQPFIKDDKQTIEQVLGEMTAKIGERLVISRFSRMKIGE